MKGVVQDGIEFVLNSLNDGRLARVDKVSKVEAFVGYASDNIVNDDTLAVFIILRIVQSNGEIRFERTSGGFKNKWGDRAILLDEFTPDSITPLNGTLSATTTAQPLRVGGSNLITRETVAIYATDNSVVWGYDASCPFPVPKKNYLFLEANRNQDIYIKTKSGTSDVIIAEK